MPHLLANQVLEEQQRHSLDRYTRRKVKKASGGQAVAHCPLCLLPDQQWDPR